MDESPHGGSPAAEVNPKWLSCWTTLFVDNLETYAVFATDLSGTILTWQPGVKEVLGYEQDAFVGQPADMIFTEADRKAGAPQHEMDTALQKGHARDERWHLCASGDRFWGSGVMLALHDESGEPLGFAKLVRDNTKVRLADEEKELNTVRLESDVANKLAQVRVLAADLTLAEQRERRRISQILHDELQQQLYALQMMLANMRVDSPTELAASLTDARELAKASLATTRTLVSALSPAVLNNDALDEALIWLAQHMQQRYNLKVTVSGLERSPELPTGLNILLFQCVQELLFNVVKHAGVDDVSVKVEQLAESFTLEVQDEGQGFAVVSHDPALLHQEGFGLHSVQQRLGPFNGVVEIRSSPGNGTRVTITLPLN